MKNPYSPQYIVYIDRFNKTLVFATKQQADDCFQWLKQGMDGNGAAVYIEDLNGKHAIAGRSYYNVTQKTRVPAARVFQTLLVAFVALFVLALMLHH